MRIGYARLLSKKESIKSTINTLEQAVVNELFVERERHKNQALEIRPEFTKLLQYLQVGDTLVITSLEQLSQQYLALTTILKRLAKLRVELEVLDLPNLSLTEVLAVLSWVEKNEHILAPKVNRFKITPERQSERDNYHFLTKNREYKQKYWQVIQGLMTGVSLRKLAKSVGVPQGTVYRIKKHYDKVKQIIFLVGFFLITIASLKIAQNYSSNWGIQVLICGVMIVGIVWFSYSDSQE